MYTKIEILSKYDYFGFHTTTVLFIEIMQLITVIVLILYNPVLYNKAQ
jgi:hypothetical protein